MSLDLLKSLYLQISRNKGYSCVVVGAKLSSPLTKADLIPYVAELVSQRDSLRRNIIDNEVVEITFDIAETVEEGGEGETVSEAITRLHGVFFPLDAGEPTWKFVKTGEWLLFAFEHIFLDGTSGVVVLEDLVTLMRGGRIEGDVLKDEEFDKLIKCGKWYLAKTIYKMLKDTVVSFIYSENKGKMADIAVEGRHYMVLLCKAQMAMIKEFTKKEGITFTNLLTILNSYVMAHLNGVKHTYVNIPVNERRFLDAPRAYGHHTSQVSKKINIAATWNVVKRQTLISQEELEKSLPFFGTVAYVDHEKFVLQEIAKPPSPSMIEISNIGLRKEVEGIDAFVFSQPNSTAYKTFTNNVVATESRNSIMMSYGYDSKLFDAYKVLMEKALFKLGEVGAKMDHDELVSILQDS